jgi:dTDP-4-dehydrorhamnose reductase
VLFEEAREGELPYAHVRPIARADYPTRAIRPGNSALDCSKFKGRSDVKYRRGEFLSVKLSHAPELLTLALNSFCRLPG